MRRQRIHGNHGLTRVKNANETETSKPAKTKTHHEGEKLVIRRLPPGMTQAEFVAVIGSDWDVGKGKVDWFSYAPGKISNEYGDDLHALRR